MFRKTIDYSKIGTDQNPVVQARRRATYQAASRNAKDIEGRLADLFQGLNEIAAELPPPSIDFINIAIPGTPTNIDLTHGFDTDVRFWVIDNLPTSAAFFTPVVERRLGVEAERNRLRLTVHGYIGTMSIRVEASS